LQLGRQRLPQKDIVVEVDERLGLHAIGIELAQRPPLGVGAGDGIQSGVHDIELQADAVHEHARPRVIGIEHGGPIVALCRLG
jgi:hypothetical protein